MSQGEAQEGAVSTRLKRMYWRCSNSHFRLIVSLVLIQIATCVGHLLSLYDLYDATDLTTLPWVFYFLSNLMKQCTDRNQLMALTLVGFSFVFRVTFQRLLRYSISPPSLGCTHITELGKLVPWKAFWAALYWETNSPRSLIVGYYSYIKYLHPTASTKSKWTLNTLYLTCMEPAINAAYARPCANPTTVADDDNTLERGSTLMLLKDDTATNTKSPVDRNSAMLRRIRFK